MAEVMAYSNVRFRPKTDIRDGPRRLTHGIWPTWRLSPVGAWGGSNAQVNWNGSRCSHIWFTHWFGARLKASFAYPFLDYTKGLAQTAVTLVVILLAFLVGGFALIWADGSLARPSKRHSAL